MPAEHPANTTEDLVEPQMCFVHKILLLQNTESIFKSHIIEF